MTGALSPTHWLVILVVVLLLFGAKRMPDAARGIGRSLRIFKAETSALTADSADSADSDEAAAPAPAPAPSPAPAQNGVAPTSTNSSTV